MRTIYREAAQFISVLVMAISAAGFAGILSGNDRLYRWFFDSPGLSLPAATSLFMLALALLLTIMSDRR